MISKLIKNKFMQEINGYLMVLELIFLKFNKK